MDVEWGFLKEWWIVELLELLLKPIVPLRNERTLYFLRSQPAKTLASPMKAFT